MRTVALSIAITAWMSLAGAAAADGAQDTPAALTGAPWRVVEITGTPVPRDGSSPGREPHLVFDTAGRVSGSDGCNRLTGPYTSTGNGLSFGALVGTMMACPKVGDLPQRVRRALEGTSHYSIVDGRLELLGATGKPLAVLERQAESRGALLGTSWQLASLKDASGRTLTPDDPTKDTAFSAWAAI